MTEDEFDVLDELYFIQSFAELKESTGKTKSTLSDILSQLFQKGWIRVYQSVDEELQLNTTEFHRNSENYLYLASKKGLMAHNTTS